jgi:hypothetical protein
MLPFQLGAPRKVQSWFVLRVSAGSLSGVFIVQSGSFKRDSTCVSENPFAVSIVGDPGDSTSNQADLNHRVGRPSVDAPNQGDDGWFAVYPTQRKSPGNWPPLIVPKVWGLADWTRETISHENPCVCLNQLADAVPVPAIEARYILPKRYILLSILSNGRESLIGSSCQFGASPVERSFDRASCRTEEIRNFFQRVLKDILQQDASTLSRGKELDEIFNRIGDVVPMCPVGRSKLGHIYNRLRFGLAANLAPTYEVDAPIMGDSEEPGRERSRIVKFFELPVRLEQYLLNDVLSVQDGSGHARAISMEPRPELRDGLKKPKVPGIE